MKFLFALWLSLAPAQACLVQETLSPSELEKADLVFHGHALKITAKNTHIVLFAVDKVLKGNFSGKEIEVYWQNGSFGELESVAAFEAKYGKNQKVGVILPETIKSHLKCGPKPAVTGDGKKVTVESCSLGLPLPFYPSPKAPMDKPWIVSEVCTPAYVFPVD